MGYPNFGINFAVEFHCKLTFLVFRSVNESFELYLRLTWGSFETDWSLIWVKVTVVFDKAFPVYLRYNTKQLKF